jgi:pimeloyl-ACP methyl ester carboxylesterase
VASRAFALIVAAVLAVGCGGETPKPRSVPGLEGSIVDVGGRYLYFECVGSGSPTVLLEAGFGGSTKVWRDVQPRLGTVTRTCSYDRAGLGGSEQVPGVHDAGDEIDDLERVLERADIDPPYVLVGHSYGGLLARLFAHEHPEDVAGVVLVDSMHADHRGRALLLLPRTPAFAQLRRELGQDVVEGVDIRAGEALDRRVRSLATSRLVVVTAGRRRPPDLPASLRAAERSLWSSLQGELAALSRDSIHVVALRSDHFVQGRFTGQPDVVVRAADAVVDASRRDAELASCVRIFRGLAVRCLR